MTFPAENNILCIALTEFLTTKDMGFELKVV